MSFALPTGAEARWTGTPGPRAVDLRERRHRRRACRARGARRSSGSCERLAADGPPLPFLEVRYRIKSWRRLPLCIEDARAAIEVARAAGAEEIALLGFSMGGAVSVHVADDPAVSTVIALAPWLYPELDVSPLDGRRFAVLHGSLDRGLPGVPGVRPELSLRGYERAKARGVDASRHGDPRRDPPDRASRAVGQNGADAARRPLGGPRRRRAGATVHVGLYRGVRGAVYVLARLLYRIEIVGRVPPGPCVVAANHESLLDPPLLALVTRRPLHFLAKVELWRYRPGAWLMDALGGIPIASRPAGSPLGRPRRGAPAGRRVRRHLPAGNGERRRLDARRRPARARRPACRSSRSASSAPPARSRTAASASRRSGSSSASRSRSPPPARRSPPSRELTRELQERVEGL